MKGTILFIAALIFSWAATAQLLVQNGATLYLGNNSTLILQDVNLVNEGAILMVGNNKVRFTGSSNSEISGSQGISFRELEIAKTGANKLLLFRDVNVNGKIIFTTGLIDLNNQVIKLSETAFLENETGTSRIIGPNGGYVEITVGLIAPVAVDPGNLGAMISSTQNLGSTFIRRGHTSQMNGNGVGYSIHRYFDILPTNNNALDATLRFHYFDEELNGIDENNLVFWKSNNNISWSNRGFNTRNVVDNYVEKNGINDFSRWTLSSFDSPLPLQFLLFNVRCMDQYIMVNWKTAQEINTARFEVERSLDGSVWTKIGTVTAVGNSSTTRSYSFNDDKPLGQPVYYRIVSHDLDGRQQYSGVVHADCNTKDSWKSWPNPVQELMYVSINTQLKTLASINIFDNKGSLVLSQQYELLPGTNQFKLDMKNLSPGTYHVNLSWNEGKDHQRFKIIKL